MNAVFISLPNDNALARAVDLARANGHPVQEVPNSRWMIGTADEHVWLFEETDPNEVPPEMGQLLGRESIPVHAVLVLEYSSLPLLKKLVRILAAYADTMVDNDHGTSLPGPDFITRLQSDVDWDWRMRE